MIPSIVGAGIIGKFLYDINESHSMEEEAEEKRLEAIAREAEGWLLQKQEADRMQRRLNNIVRKRQAIMEYTLPRFVKVYGKIQTVLYESLPPAVIHTTDLARIGDLPVSAIESYEGLSSNELASTWLLEGPVNFAAGGGLEIGAAAIGATGGIAFLTLGVGASMKKDSERALIAAGRQMRAANAVYAQAESHAQICRAICQFADRIAEITAAMNLLFTRAIAACDQLIQEKGTEKYAYTDEDVNILMTCANLAGAVCTILTVPIMDSQGKIAENGQELIASGVELLTEAQSMCLEAGI